MLKIKVLCVSMLLLFITMPAHGQSSSSTSDTWQFEVSPYIFTPAVEGDTTVNGQTMPLDLSFGDIFDNFDVFGLSGRVRARKGKWGIIFDVATLSLETEVIPNIPIPPVTAVIAVPYDKKSGTILRGRFVKKGEILQIVKPEEVIDGLLQNIFRIKNILDAVITIVGLATILAIFSGFFAIAATAAERNGNHLQTRLPKTHRCPTAGC
jgi:hypothetical protein